MIRLPEFQRSYTLARWHLTFEGGHQSLHARAESVSGPEVHLRQNVSYATAYLRAAQAYMLISMPTGTSTIFGVFQAILALLLE
jgi:hypothetical protein